MIKDVLAAEGLFHLSIIKIQLTSYFGSEIHRITDLQSLVAFFFFFKKLTVINIEAQLDWDKCWWAA